MNNKNYYIKPLTEPIKYLHFFLAVSTSNINHHLDNILAVKHKKNHGGEFIPNKN